MGVATARPQLSPISQPQTTTQRTKSPQKSLSEPVSVPSAPMLIQPRYHSSTRNPDLRTQTVMHRGQHGGRQPRRPADAHDPNALNPAVAALLAVTAIPPPRGLQRRRTTQNKRVSIDELIQEWRQEGGSSSEPFKTALNILLEPADEAEDDNESMVEVDDDKEGGFLSSRSVSSDSIASTTPSLDPAESTMSTLSNTPSTPSFRSRRSGSVRADKLVVSPPIQKCFEDHPLHPPSPTGSENTIVSTFVPRATRTVREKSSFKSNLTASLNALKSAAKSFSNFTAPSIPSDDMLARSLFSSRFTSEMRPKNIDGFPDPALRRYLNPIQGVQPPPLSLDEFSSQVSVALAVSGDDEGTPTMIQMQTYSRTRRRSRSGKSGTNVGPDAGEANLLGQNPAVRQREPRENSDFLRVVVLELNMRRTGKLDMKSPGRARIWLPARKNGELEVNKKAGVPVRWIGMTVEDI